MKIQISCLGTHKIFLCTEFRKTARIVLIEFLVCFIHNIEHIDQRNLNLGRAEFNSDVL